MKVRILLGLIGVLVVGTLATLALGWRPEIPTQPRPALSSFSTESVKRGAVLASAGYCAVCHTAPNGRLNAGGYAMNTGFGTIYSTNITPDRDTGIGLWSEVAFRRAMHQGIARNGSQLFPAFPFDHFTKLSDEDVSDLYAFVMTRPPVRSKAKANTLPFPLNVRLFQGAWKLLFFRYGRFSADTQHAADWNRGAYLASGVSHCGACHTPRNALGAERMSKAFAGASIDTWYAPPLTALNPSPVAWSSEELYNYLREGVAPLHGTSAGPMARVIHEGLAALPNADVRAIALYFTDVDGAEQRPIDDSRAIQTALVMDDLASKPTTDPAAALYASACASCHYNADGHVNPLRPDLALVSALALPDPANFIHVVLEGIGPNDGAVGVVMPRFADAFSDVDVARLAGYLRATRTGQPAWTNLPRRVANIRAQMPDSRRVVAQPLPMP